MKECTLQNEELEIRIKSFGAELSSIKNKRNDVEYMYFSIGAHPAFRCPLIANGSLEDHFIEFNEPDKLVRYHLDKGLLTHNSEELPMKDGKLFLNEELFKNDALVFKNLKSNSV